MVTFWGHEFYPLPKKFGIVMLWAIGKRFGLGQGVAKDKVYNGLGEARMKVRCEMRNYVLRRRREPNAHEIWDMLLKDEMMKFSKFSRVINLPAPFDKGDEELTRFCDIYRAEMDLKYPEYKVYLAGHPTKKDDQDEFEHILEFGYSRGFGHEWQPLAANEWYNPEEPPPPTSVQGKRMAAEKAKKDAAKAAGVKSPKSPRKKKKPGLFDVDVGALPDTFSDEEKE